MRSAPLSILFLVVALACVVVAILYAFGILQIAVTDPTAKHHYTHTLLFAVLAVASLVAWNFTRPRTV